MSAVTISTLGWGVLQDSAGNVQAGAAYSITLLDGTPVTSGTTNSRGEISGTLTNGAYKLTALGRTVTVHVTESDLMPTAAEKGRIPTQLMFDALGGTNGAPSGANRFLSETDARIAVRLFGGATTTALRESAVTADTQPRWQQLAGGAMLWGAGLGSALDTQLDRAAAGRLRFGSVGGVLYEILRVVAGPEANRPAATTALEGLRYVATDTGQESQVVGGAWVNIGGSVPIGAVVPYTGTTLPTGGQWDWADGGLIDKTTYATFFARTGHSYNGNADPLNNKVRKPDKRGRGLLGAVSFGVGAAPNDNVHVQAVRGGLGGEVNHALTAGESGMVAHSHANSGGPSQVAQWQASNVATGIYVVGLANTATGVSGGTSGSNHNTVHPYEADNVIVRIA